MASPAYDISQQDAASLEDLRRAVNDRLRRLGAVGSLQITGELDMQGNRIVNLGAPGGLNDAATLADVRRASTSPVKATVSQITNVVEAGAEFAEAPVR